MWASGGVVSGRWRVSGVSGPGGLGQVVMGLGGLGGMWPNPTHIFSMMWGRPPSERLCTPSTLKRTTQLHDP